MVRNDREPGADVGMIGLGVMGRNLALNMADHRFRVAVYNREAEVLERFVAEHADTPGGLVGCRELRELVSGLKRPRRIVLLIKAGAPVDSVLAQLVPLLSPGDVVVDGGNSLFTDTIRRERELALHDLQFVGSGVSGGEEGARFGPSLMPGCSPEAWEAIRPIWTAIAAKVDERTGKPIPGAAPGKPVVGGVPCTTHIGPDGSGHYVKMVHNGIEYADLQLIGEAYFLLARVLDLGPVELSEIFAGYNEGDLDSYLIEITSDILRQRDPARPEAYLIESVLDAAGQKGTGAWAAANALELRAPAPTLAEAVCARQLSSLKEQRVVASRLYESPSFAYGGSKPDLIEAVRDALLGSKICSYAQGFALMAEAQRVYHWSLELGEIARIWRGGCIIRARFLQKITEAHARAADLENLLLDPYFAGQVRRVEPRWRRVVALAAEAGLACPAFMSALAYFDGYRTERLPASLLQAQRDFFGAHGFERLDRPRGTFFHVDWQDPRRPLLEIK